jgi:hypothetical protein
MTNKIEIKLVETNFFTRWSCTVCGGCTEKDPVLAESELEKGDGVQCIRVCDLCLKAGDINDRLRARAANLRQRADYIESLIGRLIVPTYQEWQAACDRADEEFCRRVYGKSAAEVREHEKAEACGAAWSSNEVEEEGVF